MFSTMRSGSRATSTHFDSIRSNRRYTQYYARNDGDAQTCIMVSLEVLAPPLMCASACHDCREGQTYMAAQWYPTCLGRALDDRHQRTVMQHSLCTCKIIIAGKCLHSTRLPVACNYQPTINQHQQQRAQMHTAITVLSQCEMTLRHFK